MGASYRAGEVVVYDKWKHGTRPGQRAREVRPAPAGEAYDYVVPKYWIIESAPQHGPLTLRTPGGKRHEVEPDDPCLRRPSLLEWLWLRVFQPRRLHALRAPQT